jgi:hypothetical protein
MILAVYVIGSAVALIVLTIRLRDTRDQLRRMKRERNTLLSTIETALPASAAKDPTAASADGSALPHPLHGERW